MNVPESFVVDTDVVIDYLRERSEAVTWWESGIDVPNLSAITVGELFAGVRDGAERVRLDIFLRAVLIVPVSREIAEVAGLHVREFRKSHSVALPDAIIAATAQNLGLRLVSRNTKHFPMLTDVLVPYTRT